MKKLTNSEHKKIMIEMLAYINDICQKNNINYTLIGGSLIGAIRHKGIIPWDDDIDIGLMHDDYVKLLAILKKEKNNQYKVFDDEIEDYYYPYAKLVSQTTILEEKNLRKLKDYGIFIDIFEYNFTPDDEAARKKHYRKIKLRQKLIGGYFNIRKDGGIIRKIRNQFCNLLGIKLILKIFNKELHKYNNIKTGYLISNWPQYSMEKEVMKTEYFEEFMFVKFEGMDVMITKKYDKMLTQVFGDYMTLPPEDKRVAHNIKIYWRDNCEEKEGNI